MMRDLSGAHESMLHSILSTLSISQPPSRLVSIPHAKLQLLSPMCITRFMCYPAGKTPCTFPQKSLRIDYSRNLVRDSKLDAVLAGLLQSMAEDRMSAREALDILERDSAIGRCD